MSDLEKFWDRIKQEFPNKQTMSEIRGTIDLNIKTKSLKSQGLEQKEYGIAISSKDKIKAIQTRLNGFSLSISKKSYTNWKDFKNEAKSLFNLYKKLYKPTKINRISLRYINQIDIPLKEGKFEGDLNHYIKMLPNIPSGLPNMMATLFTRFTLIKDEYNAFTNIRLTFENIQTDKLPFIFDIDVLRKESYIKNQVKIWNDFDILRQFKNEIFFCSITDKTKKLIE